MLTNDSIIKHLTRNKKNLEQNCVNVLEFKAKLYTLSIFVTGILIYINQKQSFKNLEVKEQRKFTSTFSVYLFSKIQIHYE